LKKESTLAENQFLLLFFLFVKPVSVLLFCRSKDLVRPVQLVHQYFILEFHEVLFAIVKELV